MSHRKFRAPRHGSLGFLVSDQWTRGVARFSRSSCMTLPLTCHFSHSYVITAQEEDQEAPGQDPLLPQGGTQDGQEGGRAGASVLMIVGCYLLPTG